MAAECAEGIARANAEADDGTTIAHANRAAAKAGAPWEQAAIWCAAALRTKRVDETTLQAYGMPAVTIRHAAALAERDGETAVAYAGRIVQQGEIEVLSAGCEKVADAHPDSPLAAADEAERADAVRKLRNAMDEWSARHRGRPAGNETLTTAAGKPSQNEPTSKLDRWEPAVRRIRSRRVRLAVAVVVFAAALVCDTRRTLASGRETDRLPRRP